MKKSAILAFAAALMMGQSVVAQNVKEIAYVEDATQGYLFNRFQDNWFITGEFGVANSLTRHVPRVEWTKRFAPTASLYIGKYFSPLLGVRVGAEWVQFKNKAANGMGVLLDQPTYSDGLYKTRLNDLGIVGDVMLSLTNWWCGYNPDRVFNAQIYAGVGGYLPYEKKFVGGKADGYRYASNPFIAFRAGLLFDFNISKNFALGIDLRGMMSDKAATQKTQTAGASFIGEALIAATYKFNKSTWSAPVVAVIPEIEDCEPLRARLAAADARIEDLEAQLRACLNRPVEKVVEAVKPGPLATIYFPIGVSRLNYVDTKVLGAVAEQIKASGKDYTLTGWADTYTGTDAINARLRVNRAKSVERELIRYGVPASKLTTKSGEGNLNDLGIKYVALDRCVTIDENN